MKASLPPVFTAGIIGVTCPVILRSTIHLWYSKGWILVVGMVEDVGMLDMNDFLQLNFVLGLFLSCFTGTVCFC